MPNRSHPFTAATRVSARELARIDAAARLRGICRSEYVREVVTRSADQEIRKAANGIAQVAE